jgi:peroxiredoxin
MKIQIFVLTILSLFAFQGQAGFSQNQPLEFVLPDTQGEDVSLEQFSGKKAIVVFWSSNNPASIDELENLAKISQDSDIVLIGVNIDRDTSAENIELIAESKEWTFVILLDPKLKVFTQIFPKQIIPSTLIINTKHEIIEQKQGFIPGDDEWILARAKEL